jgi:ABC-type Fe3+-hydroxamate transport system substrate-binding protein
LSERLQALGLRVLALDPHSIEDVLGTIETLGARVGREQAARARVEAIRGTRARVASEGDPGLAPRTVLVLQRDPLFVVGAGSFIDEMLRLAGAHNIGAALEGTYPRASLEWLVAERPEVLLDASADPDPPGRFWSRWPSVPAVANGRVMAVDPALVTLPGPRLDQAIEALAAAIRGAGASAAAGDAR